MIFEDETLELLSNIARTRIRNGDDPETALKEALKITGQVISQFSYLRVLSHPHKLTTVGLLKGS